MSMSKYEVLLQRVEEVLNLSLPVGSPDKAVAAFDGMKQLYKAIWDISMWHSQRKPMRLRACGAKQPGWYWLDNTSGISINVRGDSVLVKGHYDPTVGTHPELVQNITTFVPATWLGVDGMRTLWSRVQVVDNDGNAVQLPFAIKALHVWGTTDLRELFNKLMQDKTLQFYMSNAGGLASYKIAQNMGFVKAEHNIKGLKGRALPDTNNSFNVVKAFDENGVEIGLHAYEDPSKLNERFTKIFGNSDGIFVGKWKVVVVMDRIVIQGKNYGKFQDELDNAFCTGTAYSKGLFRFVGPSRLVTKLLGGKMTIASPWQFDGFDDKTIIANVSTWKGGLNCLLAHLGVMSQKDQIKFCDENPDMSGDELTDWATSLLKEKGLIKTKRIKYRGHYASMTYIESEEDVYATNLYALYGCQYKEEVEVESYSDEEPSTKEEVEMDPEYDQMDLFVDAGEQESVEPDTITARGSYFTTTTGEIVRAANEERFSFNLNKKVMEDEAMGVIVKSKPVTSFSIRELTNYFWSYAVVETGNGFECQVDMSDMHKLMYRVVKHNNKVGGKRHKDMQKLFVNGKHKDTPVIGIQELCDAISEIFSISKQEQLLDGSFADIKEDFPITERGWHRNCDGLNRLSNEDFVSKWNKLMKGFDTWPGLGNNGFVVKVDGYQFYVPGYKFLKASILPLDKATYDPVANPESLFGDSMQTVMMLFVAAREHSKGKAVNWAVNAAQHLTRMNSAMFEDKLNRMACAGTYLTIAPKFWDASEQGYISSVVALAAPEGHMSYSKDPVLFDKGFTGVMNGHNLPDDLFTDLDSADLYGMRSVAFVNTDLLLSQENDSDGDLCCLRYGIKAPLYTGQWRCMEKRVNAYIWGDNKPGEFGDGERNYKLKFKRWKLFSKQDIAIGIDANKCAKENISLMTSSLYQHSMMLEWCVLNGYIKPFWAKMLWSLYGYIVQDEAMRMIKHSDGRTGGQSDYYKATSVLVATSGDWKTMFHGLEYKDGVIRKDHSTRSDTGFLHAIEKYWDGFDKSNDKHKESLGVAIQGYVTGIARMLADHYAVDANGNVPNNYVKNNNIGRFSSANNAIQLSLDLANSRCSTGLYKMYNVLQRGYFSHCEANRIMISQANNASITIKSFSLKAPGHALGVKAAVSELADQGCKLPAVQAMSLAYILDDKVKTGWMQQHNYVGMGHTISSDSASPVCVMWLDMVKHCIPAKQLKKPVVKAKAAASSEPVVNTKPNADVDAQAEFKNIISAVLDDMDSFGNILYPSAKK